MSVMPSGAIFFRNSFSAMRAGLFESMSGSGGEMSRFPSRVVFRSPPRMTAGFFLRVRLLMSLSIAFCILVP